jgi:hypothetical protein
MPKKAETMSETLFISIHGQIIDPEKGGLALEVSDLYV